MRPPIGTGKLPSAATSLYLLCELYLHEIRVNVTDSAYKVLAKEVSTIETQGIRQPAC